MGVGERVLHNEHQNLHAHAETQTHYREVAAENPDRQIRSHRREQAQADRHNDRPRQRQPLVAARAADQLTGRHRTQEQSTHHRNHQQSGLSGIDPRHHLQVGGHVGESTKHGDTRDETGCRGQNKVAFLEHVQRHDRLGRCALHHDEGESGNDRESNQPDDDEGIPVVLRSAPRGNENDRR